MRDDTILVRAEGAVTVVTLNRPERLNALNRTMSAELHDALDAAEPAPGMSRKRYGRGCTA